LVRGGYYVSCKKGSLDLDSLKYALAFVNSGTAAWFLSRSGRRYAGSYNRIEVTTLKQLPIPLPEDLPPQLLAKILGAVDTLLAGRPESEDKNRAIRDELDNLTALAYGWTDAEKQLIG